MTAPLFIGIDAGGTKTALLAHDGRQSYEAVTSGTHLLREGVRPSADALEGLVRDTLGDRLVSGICVGIAGAGREGDRLALETELSGRFAGVPIRIVHDAEIALQAAWGEDSGVVLIVGTGSVLFARDLDGEVSRAGGWGWRVGDDGSGTALGRAALRIALAAHDGGPPTALTDALAESGLDTADAIRHAIYSESRPLGSFAPALVTAAEAGDWQCEQAIMRETNALGQQAGWLATRLGETVTPRLALIGGLSAVDAYRTRLEAALTRHLPGWSVARSQRAPVEGALAMAQALETA